MCNASRTRTRPSDAARGERPGEPGEPNPDSAPTGWREPPCRQRRSRAVVRVGDQCDPAQAWFLHGAGAFSAPTRSLSRHERGRRRGRRSSPRHRSCVAPAPWIIRASTCPRVPLRMERGSLVGARPALAVGRQHPARRRTRRLLLPMGTAPVVRLLKDPQCSSEQPTGTGRSARSLSKRARCASRWRLSLRALRRTRFAGAVGVFR